MNKLNAARLRANDFPEHIFCGKKCRNETGWGFDGLTDGLPINLVVSAMGHAVEFRRGSRQLSGGHRGLPGSAARILKKMCSSSRHPRPAAALPTFHAE
ncbi:hypothetical protein [Burkholderia lata]|uniref:hypothetical protein n=1 Tax=Burkholderia lata (strain ATCC 17760 / DSM 23089 / LMG 22485 / NCIMB 9086 / R18194 / 383) TaxID=482957 RepID=UPI0013DE239E|nr:hypothetical protein [Burkholderia lata]